MIEKHSELGVTDTFRLSVYEGVEDVYPHFEELGPKHQRLIVERFEPVETYTATNIVQEDLLADIVDSIDPNTTATGYDADQLAVGDGTSTPKTTDGGLDNEFDRVNVGTFTNNTSELQTTTTFGGSTDNGETFAEVGLLDDANGTFLNRALIGPRTKNVGETFTIDVNLNFTPL
jgi:hypothetical protein